MFDTTHDPAQFVKSYCDPSSGHCSRCFELPINTATAAFLPNNCPTTYGSMDSFPFEHPPFSSPGYYSMDSDPSDATNAYQSVNVANGARLTEIRGVIITNLDVKVTDSEVKKLIRRVGAEPLNFRKNTTGRSASVEFRTPQEAQIVINQLQGKVCGNRLLAVRHDRDQGSNSPSASTTSSTSSSYVGTTSKNRGPPIANGSVYQMQQQSSH